VGVHAKYVLTKLDRVVNSQTSRDKPVTLDLLRLRKRVRNLFLLQVAKDSGDSQSLQTLPDEMAKYSLWCRSSAFCSGALPLGATTHFLMGLYIKFGGHAP
jgi:hypothetical protein